MLNQTRFVAMEWQASIARQVHNHVGASLMWSSHVTTVLIAERRFITARGLFGQ